MPKKIPSLTLPSADDLFKTQEERDGAEFEKVIDVALAKIDDFPGHPFLVKMDDSMQAMVESVKAVGIQTPAVVRLKENGRYELISGHRRKKVCALAGLESLRCIVREMSGDEAVIAMVDSNLQREVILPSEKAMSYKMKLEAMKRQGKRADLTSVPVAQKLHGKTTRELIGEQVGESQDQVRRYIRLTELIPHLLKMVDEKQLPMRPAVEISYLPHKEQEMLFDAMESEACAPSQTQALKLRKLSSEGNLDYETIISIMRESSGNQTEYFKLPYKKIHRFFPSGTPANTIEETIVKALELWHKNR